MFDIQRKTITWAGRPLTLETGRIARQADGAVLATYGETTVLATVVSAKEPKPGFDFFPLTVNYQEKTFAAGKIPGGYFKREGRPTEKETLVSRLIDRPIRPLFADGYKNDTQVIVTVVQHDLENDPDVLGMVAASAALTISGVPFMGPIGAARVGVIDGELVLNPTIDLIAATTSELSSAWKSKGSLAACSARSMIASITGCMPAWANIRAFSMVSSDSSLASDSTIIRASAVPATTRSRSESGSWSMVGFRTSSPSI